jgi:Ca-activated chloride channel family protein
MNTIKLNINADTNLVAEGSATERILEVSVTAPVIEVRDRPRLNLALVLDRSGSMSGDKLSNVRKASRHVLDLLQESDHVAIVAYDDEVTMVSPSVAVTPEARRELKQRVTRLEPGGSTNLSEGWLTGCREIAAATQEGMVNRALLLTDGLANVGIQDLEELATHARELSRRGIATSTFGVGNGFNEHLLEAMSNQGGGSFYYIDSPEGIPAIFAREFAELAAVSARAVEVVISIPAGWRLEIPGGWRTIFDGNQLRIFLGDLFSGQTQEIYIRAYIPTPEPGGSTGISAEVNGKDEQGQLFHDQANFYFQAVGLEKLVTAPRNSGIMERFVVVNLAEIANEALKLERNGQREEAYGLLMRALTNDKEYVPALDAEKYRRMAERMKYGMDEMDRKQSHFESYNQKRRKNL